LRGWADEDALITDDAEMTDDDIHLLCQVADRLTELDFFPAALVRARVDPLKVKGAPGTMEAIFSTPSGEHSILEIRTSSPGEVEFIVSTREKDEELLPTELLTSAAGTAVLLETEAEVIEGCVFDLVNKLIVIPLVLSIIIISIISSLMYYFASKQLDLRGTPTPSDTVTAPVAAAATETGPVSGVPILHKVPSREHHVSRSDSGAGKSQVPGQAKEEHREEADERFSGASRQVEHPHRGEGSQENEANVWEDIPALFPISDALHGQAPFHPHMSGSAMTQAHHRGIGPASVASATAFAPSPLRQEITSMREDHSVDGMQAEAAHPDSPN
jgi:hypothetical protein